MGLQTHDNPDWRPSRDCVHRATRAIDCRRRYAARRRDPRVSNKDDCLDDERRADDITLAQLNALADALDASLRLTRHEPGLRARRKHDPHEGDAGHRRPVRIIPSCASEVVDDTDAGIRHDGPAVN
ncbi:MAG: hypothetical protein KDA33_10445 [Phycisphaerales bacterium]|nr:hypothetical protein [Phycisphaerales bacterium]